MLSAYWKYVRVIIVKAELLDWITCNLTTEYSSGLGITVESGSIKCAMMEEVVVNAMVTLLQFISLLEAHLLYFMFSSHVKPPLSTPQSYHLR